MRYPLFPVLLFATTFATTQAPTTVTPGHAQDASVTVTPSPGARPAGPVVERALPVRFGWRLSGADGVFGDLARQLTPNLGTLRYSATTRTLIARDTEAALDALAARIATLDVETPTIQLDVRIVAVDGRAPIEQALGERSRDCIDGVAVMDFADACKALRTLQDLHVDITHAPQITTLVGQTATILVAKQRPAEALPDGAIAMPLVDGEFEVCMLPTIESADGPIHLDLQMRSPLVATDGQRIVRPMQLAAGQTAVFEAFAGPFRGALVFVTAQTIRSPEHARQQMLDRLRTRREQAPGK